MSIRIGLAPGPWDLSRQGSDFLWEFIEATEAQGWDSLWFSDLITAPQFSLEPLTTLGAVAGRTRRLKFGTSVLAQAVRNPVITAKELATLDFISGGRMLPAVGLGTEDPYLYEACGVEKRQRAARVEEAVPLMRRLWREENVTHRGRFYGLQDISITPRPAREGLPVWIGGRSEAALHRVGRIGDGWLASSVTPEEVARSIPVIHQAARAAGRQIDEDHFGVLLAVYATEEGAAAARLRAAAYMPRLRKDVPAEACAAIGTPEDVVVRVREYIDAGASKFVFRPACPPQEAIEQMALVARTVLPAIET